MTLTAEQHAVRSQGIGSSDAAAACGLSPWKSRAELWGEKTGRIVPEDISDRDIIHFGHVLEDVVAQEFSRRTGKKVQRWSKPYTRGDFMVANIDRLVVGEDAVLEAKTADKFTRGKWDEVPLHYRCQVAHQLITAEKSVGYLAVLIGGNEFKDFEIEADRETRDLLVNREAEFWDYVVRDVPPPVDSAADVLLLYTATEGKSIEATPELVAWHTELMHLREQAKKTDERIGELKDHICSAMLDAEVVLGADGKPIVTWKQAKGSTRTNYETAYEILAKNVDDETADAAVRAATFTTKGSRRFLPKEIK